MYGAVWLAGNAFLAPTFAAGNAFPMLGVLPIVAKAAICSFHLQKRMVTFVVDKLVATKSVPMPLPAHHFI